ncbi:MAG: hypothetical protein M5U28_32055 [Sandaracinaceae bacterium]|nr:hypothetical protein [Sandaracinaceae bacterium]
MFAAPLALAQPPEDEEEPLPEDEEDWEEEPTEEEEPRLRPPDTGALQLGEEEEEEEEEEPAEDDELPSPADAQDRLDRGGPDGTDPTAPRWTTPQTVVDLHGYLRFRGEFQDNFFVNRVNPNATYEQQVGRNAILPFAVWIPYEDELVVAGGCGGATPTRRAISTPSPTRRCACASSRAST